MRRCLLVFLNEKMMIGKFCRYEVVFYCQGSSDF
jgi:hypothetical protein